ncbi:MAG: 23S rRNA (adenine(2503)-C(2))-methyltransferase RlmN [Clostridia bacterium]
MNKLDIKSYNLIELQSLFEGLPKFRTAQVYKWIVAGVSDFDEMSNLPKDLREKLRESFYIANCEVATKQVSQIDGTVKYLFKLFDGEYIEAVFMKYHHGNTLCISTQVGCKMNCSFCATGKQGFTRNLTASEMLAQITRAEIDTGQRISNVVLMGMGEPLDNYDNVLKFLKLVSSSDNINIGMRHISLSTCGLVDKINELSKEKLQLTLSVSLHAPSDEVRNKTMPVNKKYNVKTLIDACKNYGKVTGRRISFEYAMIKGVNDSKEDAQKLADVLRGIMCHVNLIPVNEVKENNYIKSSKKTLNDFIYILEKNGLTATIRRTLGSDIDASCGQLRGKNLGKEMM